MTHTMIVLLLSVLPAALTFVGVLATLLLLPLMTARLEAPVEAWGTAEEWATDLEWDLMSTAPSQEQELATLEHGWDVLIARTLEAEELAAIDAGWDMVTPEVVRLATVTRIDRPRPTQRLAA